jgi:RNA 3'-terminal phosphate cyclase
LHQFVESLPQSEKIIEKRMFHVKHPMVRFDYLPTPDGPMIEINGAQGEGGGQILRTSLTLSALTTAPVHIHHIRANRRMPGLRPQHLAAVNAIAKLTDAEVSGAHLNSSEVTLTPYSLRPGRYRFEISTAGALSLLFQTLFLPRRWMIEINGAQGEGRTDFAHQSDPF